MCWEASSSNCPKFTQIRPFYLKHTYLLLSKLYPEFIVLGAKHFSFFGLGSPVLRLKSHYKEILFFLPLGSQEFVYSFNWPPKLNFQPTRGFNLGPLDWILGTLNTRPLLHINFKLDSSGKIRKINKSTEKRFY